MWANTRVFRKVMQYSVGIIAGNAETFNSKLCICNTIGRDILACNTYEEKCNLACFLRKRVIISLSSGYHFHPSVSRDVMH